MNRFSFSDRFSAAIWALLAFLLLSFQNVPALGNPSHQASQQIQDNIREILSKHEWRCRGEERRDTANLAIFYQRREFKPAWQCSGKFLHQATNLIDTLKKVRHEGMHASDYRLDLLEKMLRQAKTASNQGGRNVPEKLACLDLLLSDAFLRYGSHLLAGRVRPESIYPDWKAAAPKDEPARLLEDAIRFNRIAESLDSLRPPHPGYQNMKKALAHYRKIAANGGWPIIKASTSLRQGDRSQNVLQLRKRFQILEPSLATVGPRATFFDSELKQALIRFQKRHGLKADGIAGPLTLKALNVPASSRVRQIELNLERWRWLERDLGKRHILVNIADYSLSVVENGAEIMKIRIIVGRPERQTPVFSSKMSYMVVNPYWNIPQIIAIEDILPKIQNDPGYLTRNDIKVFESWRENASSINPADIDWAPTSVNESNFKHKLRQDPGPLNPLGQLKFIFPNPFAVYLHDTPQKHQFTKKSREFSSGCIRVEKAIELALYILRDDPQWTREKLLQAIDHGERTIINIPRPLNIHLMYWTAWADTHGDVHFRNDIYDRDPPLDQALNRRFAPNQKIGKATARVTSNAPRPYRHAQNRKRDNNRRRPLSGPPQSAATD